MIYLRLLFKQNTNNTKEWDHVWYLTPAIPALVLLRREDCRFKTSLDNLGRPCLKNKKQQTNKKKTSRVIRNLTMGLTQWCAPAMPATQEVEEGGFQVWSRSEQCGKTLPQKKEPRMRLSVAECFPGMCQALVQSPGLTKKGKSLLLTTHACYANVSGSTSVLPSPHWQSDQNLFLFKNNCVWNDNCGPIETSLGLSRYPLWQCKAQGVDVSVLAPSGARHREGGQGIFNQQACKPTPGV